MLPSGRPTWPLPVCLTCSTKTTLPRWKKATCLPNVSSPMLQVACSRGLLSRTTSCHASPTCVNFLGALSSAYAYCSLTGLHGLPLTTRSLTPCSVTSRALACRCLPLIGALSPPLVLRHSPHPGGPRPTCSVALCSSSPSCRYFCTTSPSRTALDTFPSPLPRHSTGLATSTT